MGQSELYPCGLRCKLLRLSLRIKLLKQLMLCYEKFFQLLFYTLKQKSATFTSLRAYILSLGSRMVLLNPPIYQEVWNTTLGRVGRPPGKLFKSRCKIVEFNFFNHVIYFCTSLFIYLNIFVKLFMS